jgi:Ca2+-binding EF-hand superfamily protein
MNRLFAVFMAGVFATAMAQAMAAEEMEMDMDKMGEDGMGGMQMMDADKDGKISKDEFMQAHAKMFAAMDRNKDGALDASEREMMMMHHGEMMHKGMMKNKHDG